MNKHHKKLLEKVKKISDLDPVDSKHPSHYQGNNEKSYSLPASQKRDIIKSWVSDNRGIFTKEFVEVLNSIYKNSNSSTEKYLAGYLIEYSPKIRKNLNPKLLDDWVGDLNGWAQIDSLCQSKFSAKDMLNNWEEWKNIIKNFSKSSNISKRRASLVLLTKPVRDLEDEKITKLAFEDIETLKSEKDKLITKAVSWLLRDMIKLHRDKVKIYLKKNKETLPKIAVRETKNKLKTGKK